MVVAGLILPDSPASLIERGHLDKAERDSACCTHTV